VPAGPAWHTLAAVRCSIVPQELSRDAFVAELDALIAVYQAAMRPDPAQLPGRHSIMQRHASYRGFRALAVTADAVGRPGAPSRPGRIVGFSYGYRRGIGRSLVLGLAEGRRERTAVLSTQDAESPARRLYRGLGFADLLTAYTFPGAPVPYAVMGAALPLRPAAAPRSPSPSAW
jgi:hypothetical protein